MTEKRMGKEFKVLALCVPATGHLNPLVSLASGLVKHQNVKVIMYGNREHQETIERANVEFRNVEYEMQRSAALTREMRESLRIDKLMHMALDSAVLLLPELIRCVVEEEIDLIVYDSMTTYAKWLIRYLDVQHAKGKLSRPPPKRVMCSAMLLEQKGLFPNEHEKQFVIKPRLGFGLIFGFLLFYLRYIRFCWKYELNAFENLEELFLGREPLNLCYIVPELQPRVQLFPSNVKFIGSSIAEEVRSAAELPEPLKTFLAPFEPVNPLPYDNFRLDHAALASRSRLIYASLGTIANQELAPYLKLLKAFNLIASNLSTGPKAIESRFLMTCGDEIYDKLQELISRKRLVVPEYVLIVKKAPQIDVLKRASLFITHSGQNSTSEAVHYGVPMICLPVFGDQPMVAHRIADDLGLGVRLDYDRFTGTQVMEAAVELLSSRHYLERSLLFSKISHKYNAPVEGARMIVDHLQQKLSQSKEKHD